MTYRCRDCGLKTATSPGALCWRCEGERRLTITQRAYLLAVAELRITSFPHSDGNVLHAPGSCRYCSSRPCDRLHQLRRRFNVGYTGATLDGDQAPCPSEAWRPLDVIELWPGNRPEPVSTRPLDTNA